MREIKFRVWNKLAGCFVPLQMYNCVIFEDAEKLQEFYKYHELMQYTNLKDKNGKEIYEGDILLAEDFGQPQRALGIVTYQGAGFVVKKPRSTIWYEWCPIVHKEGSSWEVIGNIYENGDLLEKK